MAKFCQLKRLLEASAIVTCIVAPAQVSAGIFSPDQDDEPVISQRVLEEDLGEKNAAVESASLSYSQFSPAEMAFTETVQRAVNWHPRVAEAIGDLQQKYSGVKVAKARYFPQISVGANAGYDSSVNDRNETLGVDQNQVVSLSANQVLYDFGKISSAVSVANARVDRSQAEVLLTIDQVARDTAYAAVEVQRFQNALAIAKEQVKGVSSIADLARQRSKRGASSRSDVLQGVTRIQAAQATQQQITAQLNRWQVALQSLVGSDVPFTVSPGFPAEIDRACELGTRQWSSMPEILMADATRAEAIAVVDEETAQAYPTFSLDSSANHYFDDRQFNSGQFREDPNEYTVFINVSMPLYQGGAISARKQVARNAMRAADAAKDSVKLSVMQSLEEAQRQSDSLALSLNTLSMRVDTISETRDLYRQQYMNLGTRTLLDLLNAEQELHRARFDKNDSTYDVRRLKIDCLYSAGAMRTTFGLENSNVQGVEITP